MTNKTSIFTTEEMEQNTRMHEYHEHVHGHAFGDHSDLAAILAERQISMLERLADLEAQNPIASLPSR